MKISGYTEKELPVDEVIAIDLAEITLSATPDETRKMAAFLLYAASEMERMGSSYSHVHLADVQPGFENSPHFTVFNSDLFDEH